MVEVLWPFLASQESVPLKSKWVSTLMDNLEHNRLSNVIQAEFYEQTSMRFMTHSFLSTCGWPVRPSIQTLRESPNSLSPPVNVVIYLIFG